MGTTTVIDASRNITGNSFLIPSVANIYTSSNNLYIKTETNGTGIVYESRTGYHTFRNGTDNQIQLQPTAIQFYKNATFSGAITATGVYTAGNDAPIVTFQRAGGAVSGNIEYNDATTDMELGTTTSHSFSLKTANTRRLTIASGGNATFTGTLTATSYYGDGSNLTGVSSTTINSNADNRIITGSGTANTLNAESGLTYNGSALAVTGTISSGAITSEASTHYLGGTKIALENASQNYIAFAGTTGDQPGNYNHSYIGERIYGGSEQSELVLAKYNDVEGVSGSDRIRHIANNHVFDTYIGATTPSASASLSDAVTTGTLTTRMKIRQNGDIEVGGNKFVDSSRNITAGTATMDVLTVTGNATYLASLNNTAQDARIQLSRGGTEFGQVSAGGNLMNLVASGSSTDMRFLTNSTERVRINSSGNLLVGTTDSNVYNDATGTGTVIQSNGIMQLAANNGTPLYANRQSTDGDIISFRKNGSAVGSIGNQGTRPYFASTNCGIRLGGADLLPATSTGVISDNVVSLGSSSGRFKDLYLSGAITSGAITVDKANGTGAVVGMQLLSGSSQGDSIAINFGSTTANEYSLLYDHYQNRLNLTDGGSNVFYVAGGIVNFTTAPVFSGGLVVTGNTSVISGNITTGASNYMQGGSFKVNSTTVIDGSRNITAGTIASGSITTSGNVIFSNSGTTKRGIQGQVGDNDYWFFGGGATGSNSGFVEISAGDDGSTAGSYEPIYVRQYLGTPLTGTLQRTLTLLDNNGNTAIPNALTAGTINTSGNVTLGTFGTTSTGTLILTGSTANKQAELKCTNGNLHIDAEDTEALYLNYYGGRGGIFFGSGITGYNGHISPAGNLNLSSTGMAPTGYALSVGAVGVISTSRNIANVGSISSGSISSGTVTISEGVGSGTFIGLRRSAGEIGKISYSANDNVAIYATTASHGGLNFVGGAIIPMSGGAETDNAISLGDASRNFSEIFAKGMTIGSTQMIDASRNISAVNVSANNLSLGANGQTPKVSMLYVDSVNGAVWDTAIHIGRSDELTWWLFRTYIYRKWRLWNTVPSQL